MGSRDGLGELGHREPVDRAPLGGHHLLKLRQGGATGEMGRELVGHTGQGDHFRAQCEGDFQKIGGLRFAT